MFARTAHGGPRWRSRLSKLLTNAPGSGNGPSWAPPTRDPLTRAQQELVGEVRRIRVAWEQKLSDYGKVRSLRSDAGAWRVLDVFADSATGLLGRPPGEAALDLGRPFREALGVAVRVGAEPPALAPHETHRSPAEGQVTDLDDAAAVSGGPDPTTRAARHVGRRLDEDPQLAVLFGLGQHDEPVQPQQLARVATTVTHALCPPFSLARNRKNRRRRAPTGGCLWAGHWSAPPHVRSRRAANAAELPVCSTESLRTCLRLV